ncbi:vegetative incompatibility protein HET-E-1, putative [Rhizoctonia solani AG-3 Rhs1AP]|uniref:Vegetative incompatibility protein HET-E-1, putative n=2 Tax=Rhizoctonia solani AG-3 TaxID=1086053 RepID=X8IY32_9AGAM|nr:vegetative incompatibility protein HET-E-1, putative [Rhizoctonia solani AG-3 Rhs1AP]KEP48698.1 putative vegetative incompatibility protein HET-E-1 [Rhizoctonia solani 123E]
MPFREGVKQVLRKAEDLKPSGDDIKAFFKRSGSTKHSTLSETLLPASSSHPHEQTGNQGAALLETQSTTLLEQVVSQSQTPEHAATEKTPHKPLDEASNRSDMKQFATGVVEQVVDALKIGPLRDVSDMLQGFADTYKANKSEYEALQHRLQALLKVLETHREMGTSPIVVSKITDIREFIERELRSIEKKPNEIQHGRFRIAKKEEKRFLSCCRRIQEYMDQLSAIWLTLDKLDTSLSMWKLEDEKLKDRMSSWIRLLPSSPSAWYNSSVGSDLKRRECTPGTRVDVLDSLLAWTNNNSVDAVYWLNGMAGTGKTTIAYSICKVLADKHRLAASFFCSRVREECRDVNRIIPSIAYQLAHFSPAFQSALSAVLEKDPDAHHKMLTEQFEKLIRMPLLAVLANKPLVPERMIVVIDALDECENKESTRDILNVLLSKAADLLIKFVVSSRPEPQIRDYMNEDRVCSKLVLHELDTGAVRGDIERYFREELKPMKPSPAELQIAALVEKAGVLFIYAATAVRYIGYDNFRRNPEARLRALLNAQRTQRTNQNEQIDELYMTILEAALGDQGIDEQEQNDMEQVIYTVICAREPLTVNDISELLQIRDTERVRAALRPLWSVLHVVGAKERVTTLHVSFPDFMFEAARSRKYSCDAEAHNSILAEHCLEHIERAQPQFNICELESSYLSDDMVPNIREQPTNAISSDLLYACRYWAEHGEAGKRAPTLAVPLRNFLSGRLLLWMEVLNLNKQMRAGVECMKLMVEWCNRLENEEELAELVNDALRFVETFASNPVSQSTPHIYVSSLTFWPRSRPVAKHYTQFTHGPVQAEGTALDQRQVAHVATWVFKGAINTMAMSQDGRYIALGTGKDVLIVELAGGQVVLGPLHGHPEKVKSIIFSPDQTRILAGSFAYPSQAATIIGWDTRTGDTVLGPLQLKGHTDPIRCLTFSPDCTCIASASRDATVRLWDTTNGRMLRCLASDTWVSVTAFSPDGTQIAAGADFGEILQVWDSQTGDTTFGPLNVNASQHDAIDFSPDSSHIIHFGDDNSDIHMRDAQNGDLIHKLHLGDQDGLVSTRYSPDGIWIVSGRNQSVQLWDAQDAKMVLGPLQAHTGGINSVIFTPDGSRIISACDDGLVCTWDARQRNVSSDSSTSCSPIVSAKFSSDGQLFVSGSKDGTLCIWDSYTGEIRVGPIKAHANQVMAVDFLHDRIVSGSDDGSIFVCDALSGKVMLGPLTITPGDVIRAVAYSPNENLVATVSGYPLFGRLNLWDVHTGTKVLGPLEDILGDIGSIQFSPDGTRIVGVGNSSSLDMKIVVCNVSDGEGILELRYSHTSYITSLSYSPNSALIASGSNDNTIVVWDAYTGSRLLGPLAGHSATVCSVHFSPDCTRLVSGSNDRTIRIWDVRTGEMVFELLHGHEQAIKSVAYSPDGTRILSLSDDMSVRIHDARDVKEWVGHVFLMSCNLTSLAYVS